MKPIIRVQGLGKKYYIGARPVGSSNLRESIADAARSPIKRLRERRNGHKPIELWALKDVSFEIAPGEIVGIIGRNGAGKSTLLKILSRITEPTLGRAELFGQLGSLLEVGTGFHAELTGRENLYLNGAILGMPRAEIQKKFDEIVAFSEIEKFIDTPVKRYSSGMYVRLAFSVAAHLEPEILLMDEVLSVGDAAFQHKCLNKMQDLRKDGRTVLFVSHSMQAVTRLCKRVIYLDEGRVVDDGPARQIASTYLSGPVKTSGERVWDENGDAPGDGIARLCAVRVRTEKGEIVNTVDIRERTGIEMEFEVLESGHVLVPNYLFFNEEGILLFVALDHDPDWRRRPRPAGRFISTAWVPGNFLAEGTITIGASVTTVNPITAHFYQEEAVAFQVIDSHDGDSARGDFPADLPGVIRPILSWTNEFRPRLNSRE